MKTKLSKILLILICIISFLSCKKEKNINTDFCIKSEKAPLLSTPKKIISVSPAITELIFDLGCGDRLIGRTDFCSYPPEVKNIESIGGINNANLEKIIFLKPDLVITSSIFTKKMFSTIEDAQIPIITLKEQNNIEGMFETIRILGEILDKNKKSEEIVKDCQAKLQAIKQKKEDILKHKPYQVIPKVYYVVGYGACGDYSAGKNTFINDIISLAGCDNIAKETLNWTFSKEELFANQPDYIFVRREDSANFVNTPPYNELIAVKEKRIFGIESSIMDLQTTRSIKAIEYIFEKTKNFD